MRIVLNGDPVSKRRNQQVFNNKGKTVIVPCREYRDYLKECIGQINASEVRRGVSEPVNVRCTFFLKHHRYVSLNELIEGAVEALTESGVLAGAHSDIIKGNDYSRIEYDSLNPRTEIVITPMIEKEGDEWKR